MTAVRTSDRFDSVFGTGRGGSAYRFHAPHITDLPALEAALRGLAVAREEDRVSRQEFENHARAVEHALVTQFLADHPESHAGLRTIWQPLNATIALDDAIKLAACDHIASLLAFPDNLTVGALANTPTAIINGVCADASFEYANVDKFDGILTRLLDADDVASLQTRSPRRLGELLSPGEWHTELVHTVQLERDPARVAPDIAKHIRGIVSTRVAVGQAR